MPLMKANEFRAISTNAKKKEKEKEERRDAYAKLTKLKFERESHIWRCLYETAMDGKTCIEIKNLEGDEPKTFKSYGLDVMEKYHRTFTNPEIISNLSILKKKNEKLEGKIQKIQFDIKNNSEKINTIRSLSVSSSALNKFLKGKGNDIFESNLDDWISYYSERTFYSTFDYNELKSLLEILNEKIQKPIHQTRADFLKELIKLVTSLISKYDKKINPILKRQKNLADLMPSIRAEVKLIEDEIKTIENSPNYLIDSDISCLWEIDWWNDTKYVEDKPESDHSVQTLRWLSSIEGQSTLGLLENAIADAANFGESSLNIEVLQFGQEIKVTCQQMGLSIKFPSFFDFGEILEISQLKIKNVRNDKSKSKWTISW